MAKRQNSITFKSAAIEFDEDGNITISEVGKNDIQAHSLTEWLREFSCDDLSKLVTLSIKEDNQVEGQSE